MWKQLGGTIRRCWYKLTGIGETRTCRVSIVCLIRGNLAEQSTMRLNTWKGKYNGWKKIFWVMTMISFKVVKRNKYGVKWIEEPPQRFEFREKCKYQGKVGNCEKQYYAEGYDERNKQMYFLGGCTPDVNCPRLKAWDTRHGLKKPYHYLNNDSYEHQRLLREKERVGIPHYL